MAKEPKIVPFGKYELLEKIAVGGMAEIFKARTKGVGGFEKYLAIKRILPHLSENKDFIDMLINEAKIAVMLSHANIVQIYDLGKIDDSYFIAMEYIEGKDLRALMSRCDQIGMPLFIQHAIFICIEVCKGLEYAHSKTSQDASGPKDLNIVHRDISPQNVMISYEGEVKITDFGIAKANVNISETEAGVVKGKYEYMSPEQASGLPVDRRTDIFSTGIVLYEMLTGQKPFRGESDLTILERVREAKVEPPSKYNKSIPKKLEKIVLKSLAKESDDRYQTATELKDDLTRFFYSSTFNFTTSNLAAFMKSIFAEEIKLDVLSDATGIGKRPDLEDGRTISRIFGRPDSDRFAKNKNGTGVGAAPLGAITTDSTNVGASRSDTTEIPGTNGGEGPTSSRTLGGESLSIEEEINRILIPGKTNAGKLPTATKSDGSAESATTAGGAGLDGVDARASTGESESRTAPIPTEETGSKPTVATPRPVTSSMLLGGEVQSAAMELAMEIEMAMPPIKSATNARPAPRSDEEDEEAATEAGRGADDHWDAEGSSRGERARKAAWGEDDGDPLERPTRTSASGRAVRGEPTEPDDPDTSAAREPAPERQREATIITAPGAAARTGSASLGGARSERTGTGSAAGRSSPTATGSKVPMRAVKEKVRGVTVNMPDPPTSPRSFTRESEEGPAADGEHQETIASAAVPRTDSSSTTSGRSMESTVIGRGPVEPTDEPSRTGRVPRPAREPEPEPSITGRRTPAPNRRPDRDTRPSSGVTRLGPAAEADRDASGTMANADLISGEFEAPPPRPGLRAPAMRTSFAHASAVDDQADLYPDLAEPKRAGMHPLLLVAAGAIVFLFGVLLAKVI